MNYLIATGFFAGLWYVRVMRTKVRTWSRKRIALHAVLVGLYGVVPYGLLRSGIVDTTFARAVMAVGYVVAFNFVGIFFLVPAIGRRATKS